MPEPNELIKIRRCLREYKKFAQTTQLEEALEQYISSNGDANAKNLISAVLKDDIKNISNSLKNIGDDDAYQINELRENLSKLELYDESGFGEDQVSGLITRIGRLLQNAQPEVISAYNDASKVINYKPEKYNKYDIKYNKYGMWEKDESLISPVSNYLTDHVLIENVMDCLLKIITIEGPILCRRAYRIYARACGINSIDRGHSSIFNEAIRTALSKKSIKEDYGHDLRGQEDKFVWLTNSEAVKVRSRYDRTFEEIPPSEIGALMTYLGVKNNIVSKDKLLREVFNFYHFRHTEKMRRRLLQIMNRYVKTAG